MSKRQPRNNKIAQGTKTPDIKRERKVGSLDAKRYNKDVPLVCEAMAMVGKRQAEMAESLGISRETLRKWRRKHPELEEAIRRGRCATDEVKRALQKRATGYTYVERRETHHPVHGTTVTETHKEVPPSIAAIKLCSKIRDSDR